MRGRQHLAVLGPVLVTGAAAEAIRRLLTPRRAPARPEPVDLRDHFSPEEIARGRDFSRPQRRLELVRSTLEAAVLLAAVARPPRALADAHRSAVTGAALSLSFAVPGLPLRVLAHRRARRAGLATGSWRSWSGDLVKVAAIQAGFSGALGAGAVALSQRAPRRWWLPAAGAMAGVSALAGALAPVLLEPLFNDFEALGDGETRADVLALAREAGVGVGEVFGVDASRRTTAANAYVSGLGPTKRVVLYDTMLDRYSRDEIRLVVAHELGHVRHRDVTRNLAFLALIAPALTWSTQQVTGALTGEGPDVPLTAARLPALGLALALCSAPLSPVVAVLSRTMERAADDFSLRLAGAPEAFISFERRAALQNLSDLQPGWLSRQLASHPPAAERIGAALAFAASA